MYLFNKKKQYDKLIHSLPRYSIVHTVSHAGIQMAPLCDVMASIHACIPPIYPPSLTLYPLIGKLSPDFPLPLEETNKNNLK
jgi:hypothetical protein